MRATLARIAPDAAVTYVVVEDPRKAQQHISFGTQKPGQLAREIYSFDRTGALLGGSGYGARNVGESLYSAIGPVHFGWFGGWASKIAYGLLGAGLTTVTSSGVAIWLARRRAKGRPAPRWERVWIAAVWSQPLAYGLAMLGVAAAGLPPLAVWGAGTLIAFATAIRLNPARISLVLRSGASAALVAAGLAHAAAWRGQDIDPVGWGVDVALAVLAILLLAPELARGGDVAGRWERGLDGGRQGRALIRVDAGRGAAEQALDAGQQHAVVEGLGEVVPGPEPDGLFHVLGQMAGGQHERRRPIGAGPGHVFEDAEAVHARHGEVEDHGLGLKVGERADRLEAIGAVTTL